MVSWPGLGSVASHIVGCRTEGSTTGPGTAPAPSSASATAPKYVRAKMGGHVSAASAAGGSTASYGPRAATYVSAFDATEAHDHE